MSIANRALTTRAPLAAPDANAMADGIKGSYRFAALETVTTQEIPKGLRGHFVHLQAINCRVQYAIVLKGDALPALVFDQVSTFENPDPGCAPSLPANQASREFFSANADRLTFICSAAVDESGPTPAFEVWLTDAKWTGVNP